MCSRCRYGDLTEPFRRIASEAPSGWIRPRRTAFSLVEIMIVIVIIGLLAGVVTINVRSYLNRAKQNTARQEIATIAHALETFYSKTGSYPTHDQGIAILCRPSETFPEPFLKGEPKDPWGRGYQYNCAGPSGPFEVICFGADGRPGGTGADADISSEKLKE